MKIAIKEKSKLIQALSSLAKNLVTVSYKNSPAANKYKYCMYFK